MSETYKIWCDEDEHKLYEHFVDFNEWFESSEAADEREKYNVLNVAQASKALYAGDKEAYDEAFEKFRDGKRHEALNESYITEQFDGSHWFEKNLSRFDQLLELLENQEIVPFIGAGLSVQGGFPSWKDHLRQQGRTAGIDLDHIEELLESGQYEGVIEEIEASRGEDVFIQELRDVFRKTGSISEVTLLISELFSDTIITTNYDRLIEQVFDTGGIKKPKVINGINPLEKPDPFSVNIIKLHGDILDAEKCIISKRQYNEAYGENDVDIRKHLPKLLSYYYQNSSLLFLGCSLTDDRTVQVFKKVKNECKGKVIIPQHFSIEQAPETEEELIDRNQFLAQLGIAGIWFEKEQFNYIEDILSLARSEMRARGIMPSTPKKNTNFAHKKYNDSLQKILASFLKKKSW